MRSFSLFDGGRFHHSSRHKLSFKHCQSASSKQKRVSHRVCCYSSKVESYSPANHSSDSWSSFGHSGVCLAQNMTTVVVPALVLDAVDQLLLEEKKLDETTSNKSGEGAHVLKEDAADFIVAQSLEVPQELKNGVVQMQRPQLDGKGEIIDTDVAASAAHTTEDESIEKTRKQRFVSPKDFDLLKVIGMGAFGKVLQVRNKHSGQILAMKVISKRLLKRRSGYIENIQAERNILTKVRSPFVVTMHCSFQTKEKLFIIMDFLAGGELFLRIGREGLFLEKTAAFYLAEIILALDHLHSLGILHRDLKPENILLGADGHVCLTDFGLAKDFGGITEDERALTICGTHEYMAPEMVARKGYSRAADYWSLGCIAYEMLSGNPPFQRLKNESYKDLFRKIMTERVKMPSGASAAACKLLKGLLNRNVQTRLGASRSTMFEVGGVAGLKSVDFFQGINWDLLANREITPPALPSIQNENDLNNFHEEFTNMTLPRSVLEMSREKFCPRRVESNTFRGFSFIHDSFSLPERCKVEVDEYWKTAEEDGESVSDCASSKFDGDMPALDDELDKKKRPPRKRKKKKDNTATANGTAIPSTAETPEPSEVGDDTTNAHDEPKTLTEFKPVELKAPEVTAPVDAKNSVPVVETQSSPSAKNTTLPKQAYVAPIATSSLKSAVSPAVTPSITTVGTQGFASSSSLKQNTLAAPVHNTPLMKTTVSKTSQPAPTSLKPGLPATASWATASRGQAKVASPQSRLNPNVTPYVSSARTGTAAYVANPSPVQSSVRPPVAGRLNEKAPATVAPSSDWRQHSMSPRTGHTIRNVSDPNAPAWPSLDTKNDPPLTPATANGTTTKLRGAWAVRK
jgi:serine/threonine protein kinase